MLEVPDLSHLTPDEQQKILNVIKRQQDEEEKERAMLRALQDQFEDYKSRIKTNAEESKVRTAPSEQNDPVCVLCFKTKFAEGCGHVCTFCEVRFCSRCGGRITIKSNETMWVCNLCRKQKEILTKTGAWFQSENSNLVKNLKATEDPAGKENTRVDGSNTSLAIDAGGNSIKDKPSPSSSVDKNFNSKPKVPSPVPAPRSKILQTLDANSNEKANLAVADTKMQRFVTVPNFQTVPQCNPVITQSASLTNVYKPKQNQGETKAIIKVNAAMPRTPRIKAEDKVEPQSHAGENNNTFSKEVERKPLTISNVTNQTSKSLSNCHSQTLPRMASSNMQTFVRAEQANDGFYSKRPKRYDSPGHSRNPYNMSGSASAARFERNVSQGSIVSSEDDVRSTTDYSSYGDGEKETSLSEYDLTHLQQSTNQSYYPMGVRYRSEPYIDDFQRMSDPCSCERDPGMSRGSRTESSFTALQDQLPVSWQPSTDSQFLLGHLTLCKNIPSSSRMQHGAGALLGLKVVGGKTTPSGRLGAFITKVRKGSLADTIGHLKPGDEIISWNKYCLQDATFDEVYEIILESKTDSVVELVVSRPIRDIPRIPETRLHQTAESSSCSLDSDRRDFEAFLGKPPLGKIQIKIWYDIKSEQLYVTAMRAVELSMREGGLPRNPYLKMYLLPDRSNSFKRRTKTAKKTLSPEWMQTFVYGDVRKDDLGAMALELTLWDFDRSLEANNKFMGEVIVDLGLVCLNDEPHWFHLMPLGHGMNQDYDASNHPLTLPKSVSSEANFTEPSNGTLSQSMSYMGSNDNYNAKSPKPGPKRRLPHLPTTSSQNTIAISETGARNIPSPVATEPAGVTDLVDSSRCSERSVEFETMSVDHTLQTFVGGVGPGQIIGRQALAMTSVGEIEIGFRQRSGKFLVQVKRAYKLSCRQGTRLIPVFYVKVYMMSGVQRIAKKKTKPSTRSLSPTFNENLVFEPNQVGNTVQVIVWGDYGRMDNKVFTGSSQISLDNLDFSSPITGRYKLFPSSTIFDASSYGPRQDSYSSFGSSCIAQS